MLFAYSPKAGNVPPVAVLTSTPNQTWFYNLEDVVFSSTSSYDTDGYVNYTRFYINGVLQYSSSYTSSYSACFALHGSPAGSCYQLANGATTVQVKVEVRDNSGEWSSQTKTYTIQAHKGRKYFVKDHLGTVRATVNRDGNVLGYDDYYPFGLVMSGRSNNTGNPNDAYKFTGHERDKEANLAIDYMMARNYDPLINRFLSVDPYARLYPDISSYAYVLNNPLRFIDPTGLCPEDGSEGINPNDDDGYCLAEIEVTAKQLPWQVTITYERPNYLASIGAFAAKTAPVTQADGAVLPFADALYTGLVLGKIGTTVFDVLTFDDQEIYEVMLPSVSESGADAKFPDASEWGRRLGVQRGKVEEKLGEIAGDFPTEKNKIGARNPDVGVSKEGTIVLKNRKNGKTIDTGVPVGSYKD